MIRISIQNRQLYKVLMKKSKTQIELNDRRIYCTIPAACNCFSLSLGGEEISLHQNFRFLLEKIAKLPPRKKNDFTHALMSNKAL